jgi:hypothetical protein
MIGRVAAEPRSGQRAVMVAALLTRYAESDLAGAARLARDSDAGGFALAGIYGELARTDEMAALRALGDIEDADAAAEVGLAVIAAFGDDAAAFERVGATLAAREPARGATARPSFSPLMSFPPHSALTIVAVRWAAVDPQRKLEMKTEIGDERLRVTLEAAALRAVARDDPDTALAYLANLDPQMQQLGVVGGALSELASTEPERLLASTSRWSPEVRQMTDTATLQQLAARDPVAAARYLEQAPANRNQQALAQVVAYEYGKRDAAAALAWARTLAGQGRDSLVASVIGGVADQDPVRAFELASDEASPQERMQALHRVAMSAAQSDDRAESIANRLLTVADGPLRESQIAMVVATWASNSPEGAMRWLLGHGEQATPTLFQTVGHNFARRDAQSALAYSAQIPAAAREPWVHGVAQGYAETDPAGAVQWFNQFRGEAWYESGATALAMTVASHDGAAAAQLIDAAGLDESAPNTQQIIEMIATNWANRDPAAASAWAVDRGSESQRVGAVRSTVGVWSFQNHEAARSWTLQRPPGAVRDSALAVLLTMAPAPATSSLDSGLLNAFSSETARQQAVLQTVQRIAYVDQQRARALADTHITDPELRAQAQRVIDAARDQSGRPQITFGSSDSVRMSSPLIGR